MTAVLAAAVLAFGLGAPALAEDAASKAGAPEIHRFISYNVQFLPGPGRIANKRKKLEYRAARLGEEMAKYDVIGLNEVFDDQPREILLEQVKKAWGDDYHAFVAPKPEDGRFNSGLAILSRFPILETHHVAYTVYSTVKEFGVTADGMAAKGSLHARIARDPAKPDDSIDVFVTHLEARADHLRPAQYKELSAFIAAHSDPGRPTVLMGDMNTHGLPEDQKDLNSDYHRMMNEYSAARPEGAPFKDVWLELRPGDRGGTTNQETTEKGNRIDYIFISNPADGAKGATRLEPKTVEVNFFQDPETVALSDHSAVEAEIRWAGK